MCMSRLIRWICLGLSGMWVACGVLGEDLLRRYPTTLTQADEDAARARAWEFTTNDIHRVRQFQLTVGAGFAVSTGPADVGVGHSADGAVWAVVKPCAGSAATLRSSAAEAGPENVVHIWLRFHPSVVGKLFPAGDVEGGGEAKLVHEMRSVAAAKLVGSWHAGQRVMIPGPEVLTVDVDVAPAANGERVRRFFSIEKAAASVRYVAAFEKRAVKSPEPLAPGQAAACFDGVWDAYDRDYAMFVLRPEVDWKRLREELRPQALAASNAFELGGVCADLLRPLRDLHIWVTVAGANLPVYQRARLSNANPSARPVLVSGIRRVGRSLAWGITAERVGYIAIDGWSDPALPRQFDEALEEMRDTRGLIVDVRSNGGGDERLAQRVAGRFLGASFIYGFSQYRDGAAHDALGEKRPRRVAPRGPWRYARPVLLLIGQRCMSSNESFVGMMTGGDQVKTMGDHTCGSSGNPRLLRFDPEITVSLPRWIDYRPDGTPLDERGFVPQVPFEPGPGAFAGERDDLLAAAIERLRAAPQPEKPIEGPKLEASADEALSEEGQGGRGGPDHAAWAKEEAGDAGRPHVVITVPGTDAKQVDPVGVLKLVFDRPMEPRALKLDWERGGITRLDSIHYDQAKREFSLALGLLAGCEQLVMVNKPGFHPGGGLAAARAADPEVGFVSTEQRQAALAVLGFQTRPGQKAEGGLAGKPAVVSIRPASGSTVSLLCFVDVVFDRPMASPGDGLPYLLAQQGAERVQMVSHPEWFGAENRYRLALVLPPGKRVSFSVAGWRGADGAACDPIRLEYSAGTNAYPEGWMEARRQAAKDPRLLALLKEMAAARQGLTSIVERVQTIHLQQGQAAFTRLRSDASFFAWESPNRFVADVTGPMQGCKAFRVGCDGRTAWWQYEGHGKAKLTKAPVGEIHPMELSFADPFSLTSCTPEEAALREGLTYAGKVPEGEGEAHVLQSWELNVFGGSYAFGQLRQWHIDARTKRVLRCESYAPESVGRWVFEVESVNQPVPAELWAPPADPRLQDEPLEKLEAEFNQRFLKAHDGSNGRMSVRWGKRGPQNESSSGLN